MKSAGIFVAGVACGVLAITLVLAGTGRLQLTPASPNSTSTVTPPAAAQLAPPQPRTPEPTEAMRNGSLPAPPVSQDVPPLPNPAFTAPPPSPEAMKLKSTLESPSPSVDTGRLSSRTFGLPLPQVKRSDLQNTFNDARGGGKHEAMDILAPRGTPVLAIDEGNVVKLFNSKKGGLTVYQFDNSRNYAYYYAHLDRYAEGLKEGMLLRKGDKLGYVGTTGDAAPNTPHLHLAIIQLTPEKHWWEGTAVDPYPFIIRAFEAGEQPKK